MSWFGTLTELDLYHLDLVRLRIRFEPFCVKSAIFVATAKVARANFPNQIATMLSVIA